MKRAGLLLFLLLAGCVAIPQPFESPVVQPFTSPLAPPVRSVYFPLAQGEPSKAGISMDLAYRSCEHVAKVGATWHYDWSPYPLQCAGSEAVPMLWAPGDGQAGPLPPSKYLLVGNECDGPGQCNTRPAQAARWWHEVEEKYPERLLVGPNASHLGMQWLLDWRQAYIAQYGRPPRMWALGVHCYNPPEWCKQYITANIALAQEWTTSGKVWVTEWAATRCYYANAAGIDGEKQQYVDASDMLDWLLRNPNVEREAWFIARLDGQRCETALLDENDNLTAFGRWHVDALQAEW